MSWMTARYINTARIIITDDEADFAKLFTVLLEYQIKGLVNLDHLKDTAFIVI